MSQCRVPGCTAPASRWGTLCSTHKSRQRRHGHPSQEGITKADLAPFLAVVRQRKARNPASPFWPGVEARWAGLVDHCRGVVASALSGQPMNRDERTACHEVVKLAEATEPAEVVETALALYLMLEQQPSRFRSDEAFRHQLSRRLRGLAEVNAGTWFDQTTGKVKRVYRDLPATATQVMAAMLVEVFGVAGLLLARRETEDAEKQRREVEDLAQAVKEME